VLHQGPVLRRAEVAIRAQRCPLAECLRLFEPEGTAVEKVLPLPQTRPNELFAAAGLSESRPTLVGKDAGAAGRYAMCVDKEVHVSRRGEDELLLRFLAPQSPQVRAFFVVFYADVHFTRCTAVHMVEVQGMRGEYVRTLVGQSIDRTISLLPADVHGASSVGLYTSHPEKVVVRQVQMDPSFGARFGITVTALQMGQSCCRLHAIDAGTGKCVASMLLSVSADPPVVKFAHDITLPVLTAVRKQLPFRNESPKDVTYSVRCSDPAIASVRTPQLALSALAEGFIELLFHAIPATLAYSAEMYVFITSDDRIIQETRVLRLRYT